MPTQERVDRNPIQEIANRAASAGAGLAAAAKAVGLADHKRMLDHASTRVREYHEAQMMAMGLTREEIDAMAPGAEDMGDVITTGDITFQGQQSTPNQPANQGGQPSGTPWQQILPWALAAALGTGAVSQWFASPAKPGVDTDTKYNVKVEAE